MLKRFKEMFPRLMTQQDRQRSLSIIRGHATSMTGLRRYRTRHDMAAGGDLRPLNHAGWAAVQAFRGLLGWCWILGLWGSAARLINMDSRVLSYSNPAVLPFYILHHPVILLAGCLVTGWSVGIGAKFTVIAAVSFAVIMALYELLIKRVRLLRFLFGMRTG